MAAVDSVVEEGPKAAQRVDSSRGYTPLSSPLPSPPPSLGGRLPRRQGCEGNGLKWAGSLARAYINNIRQYRIKIRIFLGASNNGGGGDGGPWGPNKGKWPPLTWWCDGGVRWWVRMAAAYESSKSNKTVASNNGSVGGRRAGERRREREVARKVERASERDIPRR